MGVEIEPDRVRDLVRKLRESEDRPDKAMRREFRALAKEIVPKARSAGMAAHPRPKPGNVKGEAPGGRQRDGEYKWATLINTIRAGADSDTPYLVYGSDRTPGWAGWEFGSKTYPQFPPRSPKEGRGNKGYFFYPTIVEETDDIESKAEAIVRKYERMVS